MKTFLSLLKTLLPFILELFMKKSSGSTEAHIGRASELAVNPVEWVEEVKKASGEGNGHPLDRLVESAIQSEETSAKWNRGFGKAIDIGLNIGKKIILPY
jgi:hypothetical protein